MSNANFAFDVVRRGTPTACKYAPRGPQADAMHAWVGRTGGWEVFVSEKQFEVLRGMQDEYGIVKAGTEANGDYFAGYVKTIYSEKKGKDYYLFVFLGTIPEVAVSAPVVATPTNCDRANEFAATLIASAIEKGRAKPDERGQGDDYLCTWLSKSQADALVAQLPATAIKQDGNIITQAVGSYCYWSKVRMATGSMLLCWMGDVSGPLASAPVPVPVSKPVAVKPAAVIPQGKRIPMDADIPF